MDLSKFLSNNQGDTIFTNVVQYCLNGKCNEVGLIKLAPLAKIPFHTHINDEEIYVVLKGTVRISNNILNAGEYHICEKGQSHNCENLSHNEAEILNLKITK